VVPPVPRPAEGQIFYSNQQYAEPDPADGAPGGEPTPQQARLKFEKFLKGFEDEAGNRPYRDQLLRETAEYDDAEDARGKNHADGARQACIFVQLEDLRRFDDDLAQLLVERPADFLAHLELAASRAAASFLSKAAEDAAAEDAAAEGGAPARAPSKLRPVQVQLTSASQFGPANLRELTSEHIGRLVRVSGIVTAAGRVATKARRIQLKCAGADCGNSIFVEVRPGIAGVSIPRRCNFQRNTGMDGLNGNQGCPLDPYYTVPEGSTFVDQQRLKLQEKPEDVPTGELPRNIQLVVDREMVLSVTPGTRVTALGVFSIYEARNSKSGKGGAAAVRQPYLRVVGIERDADSAARANPIFTEQEQQDFRDYAAQPDVLAQIFARVSPSIFGHDDVKRAVACLLFGGSPKKLADGGRLRGDINVLLLGDPSTAKSQFLKFTERTAPTAVYTSGKGSSAAGLTASVLRDPNSGEFYLEGGAMVLADGGIVCIDEFDKMRAEDRVAIHEAMEQQTISIAKAGIVTQLNARTAVLAAANPPSGRYDDLKTAQENIELQQTILSRFDLIFLVRDERKYDLDKRIAHHIINLHTRAAGVQNVTDAEREAQENFLRRYIEFCRSRCSPRLSDEAAEVLQDEYVRIRQQNREAVAQTGTASAIPITVRQLEALVRVAESLAKMQLRAEVTIDHVREALRLFSVSTENAAKSGLQEGIVFTPEQRQEMSAIETQLKQRMAVGSTVSLRRLVEEVMRLGFAESNVRRCVIFLSQNGDMQSLRGGREVRRVR